MSPELEEACAYLFKGRSNVAILAQGLDMPTEELKKIFAAYATKIKSGELVSVEDTEVSWPYIT